MRGEKMDKKYILTDGIKYIKINDKGDPTKTNSIGLATVFENLIYANEYLQSLSMVKLNKDAGKRKFYIEEIEGLPTINKAKEDKQLEEEIYNEIHELDDALKDYEYIKMSDKDNKHVYSGKTILEDNDFDFVEYIKNAIKIFSQLEIFAENMAYLEQECDLKILDIRHFKRDENTRLNAIEAQRLEYFEQELERDRIKYKRNKIISKILLKNFKRLKDERFINIIDKINNTEYRYRRMSRDDIEKIIKTKKNKLEVV